MQTIRSFAFAALVALSSNVSFADWWATGFDRWYYKDDWKAEFLSGADYYSTVTLIPGDVASAYVEVWAEQYTLKVNQEIVGRDVDAGTIEAYDLTPILHGGRNEIEITGGREVIVDGAAILKNGRVFPIRTSASWGKNVRAGRERRTGPRGYIGDAHQGMILHFTPEQRAKAAVSRVRSLAGRLRERDAFRFWRVRAVSEVMQLTGPDGDLLAEVAATAARATSDSAAALPAIARGDWDAVPRILDAPPRSIERSIDGAAADLEEAIERLSLRNDCKALEIQLALIARVNRLDDPSWPLRLQQIAAALQRRGPTVREGSERGEQQEARGETPERSSPTVKEGPYILSQARADLDTLRSEIERRLEIHLDPLNVSTQNRLGWVVSNLPLDNDPRQWEFAFEPPSARVLDLAGLWRFRLDPDNEGTSQGFAASGYNDRDWPRIVAPWRGGWERLGFDQDNPANPGRNNKPYNGWAWYRKAITLPPDWTRGDLEIDLGVTNARNRMMLFINGKPIESGAVWQPATEGASGGADEPARSLVRIPQSALAPGANTLAIRVFNRENAGGLLGPRLRLYPAGARPENVRAVCQAGIVQAADYGNGVRQVAYCGALLPAVLVAQTERQFRVHGWEAKGWPAPASIAWMTTEDGRPAERIEPLREGFSLAGADLARGWIMLAPDPDQARATSCPQLMLVLLQRRPDRIRWTRDEFGGSSLVFDYSTSPGLIGLARPLGRVVPVGKKGDRLELRPFAADLMSHWVGYIREYPVAFAEVYSEVGDDAHVQIGYDFLSTSDDWNTEHERPAIVPPLAIYARDNGWPRVTLEVLARLHVGALATPDPRASYCGPLLARIDDTAVAYTYALRKPRVHWKGVGTFAEIRDMDDSDFERIRSWGATAERPQIPFHDDWLVRGFFENAEARPSETDAVARPGGRDAVGPNAEARPSGRARRRGGLEGRLLFDPQALAWLDRVVDLHRRHDLMCILNWFWNADYPLPDLNGAPPNSDRYWRARPEARQLIIDFWSRIAERYAALPRDAVAYDLLNEPAFVSAPEYNRFIRDATAAIRAHDTTHTIFIESANGWAQPEDFDLLEATGDPNTVYSYHFYGPHAYDVYSRDLWFPRLEPATETFTSFESLEERLLPPTRFSIRNAAAPLHHGEFGITFLGPAESPRDWLRALLTLHEKYHTHWSWWEYSGRSIHRTGLVAGERVNPLATTLSEFMKK
jgi:hypothetical protein